MITRNDTPDDFKYDPFEAMSFTYDKCFLCGISIVGETSFEHIFPKWLLKKYNLWDKTINLLNGTTISYRQLTIPCCPSCNNQHLSILEQSIERSLDKGYAGLLQLDELKIFQWISKLFYGLLFKELSLFVNRKDPDRGSIVTPDLLERFRTLHGFLQSVRVPFVFMNFKPWSIFVLETHSFSDERDFDYHDGIATLTFSIRMGQVGVIACLEDNGAQREIFSDYFERFKGIKLHPLQFDELSAKVTYKSLWLMRV